MRLTVKDIKKLWDNGQAELVAGEKGLDRTVVVYDMMEQPDIKPWLRADMLLITTGYAIRNDKGAVLNLIRDLNEAGAAALAIKTRFFDHFPEEALKLADQLQFPLFFLNNALGFIEAVYPVMVAIVEAKNGVEMRTRYQIGQIEKKELVLPKQIKNVIKCRNPRCITSIEQGLPHVFVLSDEKKEIYRCKYCEEKYSES